MQPVPPSSRCSLAVKKQILANLYICSMVSERPGRGRLVRTHYSFLSISGS